jgi:CubicO group peptidase (beta-lactamase class C family)
MKSFSGLICLAIFTQVTFSCNNDTMARLPATNPMRTLDSVEVSTYNSLFSHFFDSLLNTKGFSGGILVAKNGQILYEHYQGFSDAAKAEPIHPETPFQVASTSKTFTSISILQLVQAGKLNLDDPLQIFFPLFPYQNVTVRTLLNHSSGLPYYANFISRKMWTKERPVSNEDVLYYLYANRPRKEFEPGTNFRYCNTNFALLALIVEKISGQYFPNYVRDSIFVPCGMKSSYVVSDKNPGDFSPSWTPGGRMYDFDYLDGIYGDKNVFTTCRDLLKYDSCIREGVLLSPVLLQQAWTPNFKDKHYRDSIEYYGLGWRLKVFNDSLKIPYHNGWWHGNNAVFQRVIADTAVIIVTGNHFTNKIYSAAKAANIFRPYFTNYTEVAEGNGQQGEPAASSRKKSSVSSGKKSVKPGSRVSTVRK